MPLERGTFWLVFVAVAVTAALWLLPGTEHDLSRAPQEAAYPHLPSDDLPKQPVLPKTGPFNNGWTEPAPSVD